MHLIIRQIKPKCYYNKLVLDTGKGERTIWLHSIIYIRYMDNYMVFYLEDDNKCNAIANHKDLLKVLPAQFVIINKDTIINLFYIDKIQFKKLKLSLKDKSLHNIATLNPSKLLNLYFYYTCDSKSKKTAKFCN